MRTGAFRARMTCSRSCPNGEAPSAKPGSRRAHAKSSDTRRKRFFQVPRRRVILATSPVHAPDRSGNCETHPGPVYCPGGAQRHSGRDVGIRERQPIVARDAFGLIGESCIVERPEKEIARPVTGKHPTGTVASMSRRREANHEQAGVRITEKWHRLAPVGPITIRAASYLGHTFVIFAKPGTALAGNYFVRENV